MEKLSQEYVLSIALNGSIEKEELLIEKYTNYLNEIKDDELKDTVKEFKKVSQEHIKLIKDKIYKLNIKG